MRMTVCYPLHHLAELNRLGYNDGKIKKHCQWEIDYMPAFRVSKYGQENCLNIMPRKYTFNGVNIGTILHRLRLKPKSRLLLLPEIYSELERLGAWVI